MLRSILTGISNIFGKSGFLSENASMNIPGVILVIFIMITTFVLVLFIQTEITRTLILNNKYNITKHNIGNKILLGFKGYAVVYKIKQYGANVEYADNMNTEEMINKYLSDTNKYNGCILTYANAYLYTKKYNNLVISHDFGNEPFSWIVNSKKKNF